MAIPIHCITGLEEVPMESVTVGLQWDLPRAVVVRHTLDVERGTLLRVVSDATGVVEREELEVEHLCVSCALREDILPTLDRLAALERWDSIIAHLPTAVEAAQLCRMITGDEERREELRIAGVMFACERDSLPDLLVTDDLLAERGLHTSEEDRRGVAELTARLVEYADVISVVDPASTRVTQSEGVALVRAIARPGALVVAGWPGLHSEDLMRGVHHHHSTESWVGDVFTEPMGEVDGGGVWRLDVITTDPLDPQRFLERLEDIGAGPHRTRGFFWVPSRPDTVVAWQGAGGQVSLGATDSWSRRPRHSRIVVTGLHSCVDDRARIRAAFLDSLVQPETQRRRGLTWAVTEDGLEPWLGPIVRVA